MLDNYFKRLDTVRVGISSSAGFRMYGVHILVLSLFSLTFTVRQKLPGSNLSTVNEVVEWWKESIRL